VKEIMTEAENEK